MATTSVNTDRTPFQALEKYPDAVFITDDKKLFFGNDGDVSIEYDEDGNDVLAIAGGDIRLSDTQTLQFGDGGDTTITHNGTNTVINGGNIIIQGGDVTFSDTTKLYFGDGKDVYLEWNGSKMLIKGLPIANPGTSDALFISDTGASDLRVSYG